MTNSLADRALAVRRFNRFYTRQIGALQEHLMGSGYSLAEARILYEIHVAQAVTAAALCDALDLTAGYVSRVISRFESRGLIERTRSPSDARAANLVLTEEGKRAQENLNSAANMDAGRMLDMLSEPAQHALVEAMSSIETILGETVRTYTLRAPRPGDMGWIVHKQAQLYAREYGWNSEYEALTAELTARFLREFNPDFERCWIAEVDSQIVGSVFVVRVDETTAKLRLLYVDATARGMGIGNRLVAECVQFARQVGYKRMVLWTSSVLSDAIRLYKRAGFELESEENSHSFGKDLTFQVFGIDLQKRKHT